MSQRNTQNTITDTQPKSQRKELDPEIIKMLETLKTNWTVVEPEDIDEVKNEQSHLTLVVKALNENTTLLPSIYTGLLRKSIRKTDFVVSSRYSVFHCNTCINFGDCVAPAIVDQYVAQGATSFTLSTLDITYVAAPLVNASTGCSSVHYVSGEEFNHQPLIPINQSRMTSIPLDVVIPVAPDMATTVILRVEVCQDALRKIFSGHHSEGLDAGFDLAVQFRFFVNGLGQNVERSVNRSRIKF